MVNVKINNVSYSVPDGSTILEAARLAGIDIPTLCFMKKLNEIGACRICVVEVKGARSLVTACVYPVNEGMEIFTNTSTIQKARKTTLELMLSTHERKCLSCVRSQDCELQKLCKEYGVEDEDKFDGSKPVYNITKGTVITRDNNKCILCRRCVAACQNQSVGILGANNRGFDTYIGCAFDRDIGDDNCIGCGQCIVACPTGALTETDATEKVWDALADTSKTVIVHTAPSVRATLGECFGMPVGTNVEGKMAAALRRLGFNQVFDTDVAADLTILEEANELIHRVQNGGVLPMITSCSPGWIKYCEHFHEDMIPNLSTCKSPQQMMGAVIKTYYAEKMGLDPKDMYVVSVMPCTAKKFEITRDDQAAAGVPDNDAVLTTRELARMIQRAGLDFVNLPDEEFDAPLGIATGAAAIFGATGGVMEAALRTAVKAITGSEAPAPEFKDVRGTEQIKEAEYDLNGLKIKVAVTSGTQGAKKLMEKVKNGESEYTFIEVMGCPGGCVNGGGQPLQPPHVRNFTDLKALRAKALYDQDAADVLRNSHDSPVVKELYDNYFGEPNSHKAHHTLHTSYVARGRK